VQIINNTTEIKKLKLPLAIALGNFDGVHKGHQALLHQCITESKQNGWPSAVLLWHPHPAQVLRSTQQQQIKYLNSLEQKYELIKAIGIQYLISLPFCRKIAALSPQEFVQEYLVNLCKVKKAFVGFNYSFGHKGFGTPELLKELGEQYGFMLSITKPVIIEGQIVSSTLIRQKYQAGDMAGAAMLLGYYPTISGKIVPGERRGREMGYPTANIEISSLQALPCFGVYAAFAEYKNQFVPAIANIGDNPTFNSKNVTVEVHLLNFKGDIYQESLKTFLLKKIRSEQKFRSKEDLQTQIGLDILTAQKILTENNFKLV